MEGRRAPQGMRSSSVHRPPCRRRAPAPGRPQPPTALGHSWSLREMFSPLPYVDLLLGCSRHPLADAVSARTNVTEASPDDRLYRVHQLDLWLDARVAACEQGRRRIPSRATWAMRAESRRTLVGMRLWV